MRRHKSVVWSVLFALLANVSAGHGLPGTGVVQLDAVAGPDVCDAQAAIGSLLGGGRTSDRAVSICALQALIDDASSGGEPETETLDSPFWLAVPSQRSLDGSDSYPRVVEQACCIATIIARESDPAQTPSPGMASRPPESRYRFLLTPHAPPGRA